jgi:hypothetical protein
MWRTRIWWKWSNRVSMVNYRKPYWKGLATPVFVRDRSKSFKPSWTNATSLSFGGPVKESLSAFKHLNQVAVVVCPLISLMQDQAHRRNRLSKEPVATFLGSGQNDPQEERKALQGVYNLIYVTPEKLATASFLNELAALHATKPIALFAIDESHCVSEWGTTFVPSFANWVLICATTHNWPRFPSWP